MSKSTHIRIDLELFEKLNKHVEKLSTKKDKTITARKYLEDLLAKNLARIK